jgi:ABC-type branched-subunit amino acid transport system ATPase component
MNRTLELLLGNAIKNLEYDQSVILIGANGSGKTRLGTWIEARSKNNTRIAAHKILTMPNSSTITSVKIAESALDHRDQELTQKLWNLYPNIHPGIKVVNDFEKLMNLLHSDHSEMSIKFRNDYKIDNATTKPSDTKIEQLQSLWQKLLPHRKLKIESGIITVLIAKEELPDQSAYEPSAMSDGERMMFYIMGKCLTAPVGTIIIDEPELHIHKSLRFTLYTEIEKLRPECSFIYLSHDLDFVSSKSNAKKVWVKSYNGKDEWDWQEIQPISNLPEELLITILGSRKNVVLVEGNNDSLDTTLYRHILDNKFLVIPYGGCEEIIRGVKAFKNKKGNELQNHVEVFGVIDRDRRTEDEIRTLQADNIYVLEVAEVENLFCVKGIIELVCDDHGQNCEEAVKKIFAFLTTELSTQVEERTHQEINSELKLLTFEQLKWEEQEEKRAEKVLTYSVDYTAKYQENETRFKEIIDAKDYDKLLKFYNRKSLAGRISEDCGVAKNELPQYVIHLMNTNSKEKIVDILKPYFGAFADKYLYKN